MNFFRFATLVVLAGAVSAPAAAFQVSPQQMADARKGYYDMCLKAVDMPKPFGEWDLKGNSKLPAYCDCFAPAFLDRAMRALPDMQKGKHPTLEQSNREELALRNTCRKKVGLPAAVDPNAK